MANYWFIRSFLVIVAILGEKGEALKCWTCASIFDPECGDTFQPKETDGTTFKLGECDFWIANSTDWSSETYSEKMVCRKLIVNLYGTVTVIRGCANGNNSTTCLQDQANVQFCETCEEDGCNAASRISTVALLFAPLALLLI